MESPLYTVSLLSGELMGSFYPSAHAKTFVQDGPKNGWGESEPLSPTSDYQGSSPLGSDWLDTRVDLLDYLAGPELEGLHHDEVVVLGRADISAGSASLLVDDPSARAVQVLRSLADEQSTLLAEQAAESPSNLPASLQARPVSAPAPASLEEAQCSLLDIFQASLDQSEVEEVTLDSATVLALISSQDIDDILSDGPDSPEIAHGSAGFDWPIALEPVQAMDFNMEPVDTMDFSYVEPVDTMDFTVETMNFCPVEPVQALDVSIGSLDSSNEVITVSAELSAELLSLLQPAPQEEVTVIQLDPSYSPVPQMTPSYSLASPASSASPAYSYFSDDSDPAWSPSYDSASEKPEFRSKPYERPRKPGAKQGLPREVIQHERKMRKKQQNKDAATRYRQKKKVEQSVVDADCDVLEAKNAKLHESVGSMSKEIQYLKDLLLEVYAAKGLKLPESARQMFSSS